MFSSLAVKLSILITVSSLAIHMLTSQIDSNEAVRTILGWGVALMISTAFINRHVSIPLNKLTRSMRLLEQGNSDAKLHINGSSQMKSLSDSFNLMVDRVMELIDSTAQKIFELAQAQERIGHHAELHELNTELEKSLAEVRTLSFKQESIYLDVLNALISTIEASDPYTHGHSGRVTQYSMALAAKIGLPPERCKMLEQAAILHDIGKIGIDKSILHNPGRLTEEEFATMQQHPVIATNILGNIDHLAEVQECVVKHHERYDGKGYPYGVSGGDLPIEARIMSIADTFDAMTSHRPYRRGLPVETALEELTANAGSQFDPVLVEHFVTLLREGKLFPIGDSRT